MFQEFKEALEKLVWTEVPATDPPTLPDGTPWDGRPLFDANQCGPDTELFKQTFPDWEQLHQDYISHMSIFLTMPMFTKILMRMANCIYLIGLTLMKRKNWGHFWLLLFTWEFIFIPKEENIGNVVKREINGYSQSCQGQGLNKF